MFDYSTMKPRTGPTLLWFLLAIILGLLAGCAPVEQGESNPPAQGG